jgi:hypothetical protein
MIERCAIAIPGVECRRPFRAIMYCPQAKADVGCGGFSDQCLYPNKFISQSGRPREEATFDLPPSDHLKDPVLNFQTSLRLALQMQFPG